MVVDSGDAVCAPSVAAKPLERGLAVPSAQLAVTPVVREPLPGIALVTPSADEVLPVAGLPAKLEFRSPPTNAREAAQVPAPRRDPPGAQPSTRRPSSTVEDASSRLPSRVCSVVASVPLTSADAAAPAAVDLSNETDSDVEMVAPPTAAVPAAAAAAAVASVPPPRSAAGAISRGAPARQQARAAAAPAAVAAQAPSVADFAAVRRAISSFSSSEQVLVEGLSPARLRAALPDLAPETIEVGGEPNMISTPGASS